jgi:tetratricopeptide (TPR) repeat protein
VATDRSKILQQAQILTSRGQHEAAIAEWKKLATETPNDGGIHNSIGDLYLKLNAQAEATTAFLLAAKAFQAEGATLKAIAAYKKVLKSDPTKFEVYRQLGDLNADRGLLSNAVQDYLTLGKHYLKARKGKEALEIYKLIVTRDPSNLDAQQRVAELCVQENLQDEATKVYLQLGRERSAQGRYAEAKEAYLAVKRIDPNNSEAIQFIEGVQQSGTGSIKTAASPAISEKLTATTKLKTVTPIQQPVEALGPLAEAARRIEEKQYAGAEAMLNQMLTKEPGNPEVCQLLAKLHLHRGDTQVALGEYRFLAGAALRAQDTALAESLIAEFLTVKPDSVPLLELYGELYEGKGEAEAAAQQYAKAVEVLLVHPEPGMETLHEELFEKVRTLSADAGLVDRLAAKIKGESAPEVRGPSAADLEPLITIPTAAPEVPQPVAQEAPHIQIAIPSEAKIKLPTPASAPVIPEPQISLKPLSTVAASKPLAAGAEPDGIRPVKPTKPGSPPVKKLNFDLANAAPDARGPVKTDSKPLATGLFLANAAPDGQSPFPKAIEKNSAPIETGFSLAGAEPDGDGIRSPVTAAPAPDYEAHFTLGVAYKNMGLYTLAMEEFEVSRTGDAFYLDSCLMTALCYKGERQLSKAIRVLEAVLTDPRCQGPNGQAISYELGLLYEAEAQWDKAAQTFQAIPSFHDVPQRLASLKSRQSSLPLAS